MGSQRSRDPLNPVMTAVSHSARDQVENNKEQIQEENRNSLAVAPNIYLYSLSKKKKSISYVGAKKFPSGTYFHGIMLIQLHFHPESKMLVMTLR